MNERRHRGAIGALTVSFAIVQRFVGRADLGMAKRIVAVIPHRRVLVALGQLGHILTGRFGVFVQPRVQVSDAEAGFRRAIRRFIDTPGQTIDRNGHHGSDRVRPPIRLTVRGFRRRGLLLQGFELFIRLVANLGQGTET
ncbi:hypothetical protein ACFWF3_20855, partial [Nocardia sp. NPDC060220]|uniref:hypothetical protein n=1 Tax=Nocardia sp. NPDC060220 TaxID=3347076 RepID=UPI003666CAEF